MPARRQQINAEKLRNRLKLRSIQSELSLRKKHEVADKFFEKVHLRPGNIRAHAAKLLTSGALSGTLLLSSAGAVPVPSLLSLGHSPKSNETISLTSPANLQHDLAESLKQILPEVGSWKLDEPKEKRISQLLKDTYGIRASAELEGNRLNNSYGRMGAEQHLPRYPGDTAYEHGNLIEKGITPGRGAWGYFAYSKAEMTPELHETEKWYVAVQTLYLPNWLIDTRRLAKWYRYRHVVVVNPANGKAVIAAVADAGPADWTGKHFGGSPEVMEYLEINYGRQNHPVVLFFLDDPGGKIPLGPLEYNLNEYDKIMAGKT